MVLKTGVISRKAVNLVLAKCEGLHIKQSVLGWIFGFGRITVTTGGVTSSYPYIADPLASRREINTQIG
ncbi:PH domain-containing protein [Porphyromonas cangingivalis]|uniref:PH domain-containing protein n=1 Tax=Porphyromonas cangingivalis TaxID=36874 RepID=UPI001F387492|nr:PH domain-containing protein [Porphyromonas cangingivalis]